MKKQLKVLPMVLIFIIVLSSCNQAKNRYDTPLEAIKNFLVFNVPDEFENPLTMQPEYNRYFNTIYDTIEFDTFALTIITTNDNQVNLFCTPRGSDGKYSCRGRGTLRYDFPLEEDIAGRFLDYQQDDGNWCIYGLHRKVDTPVYINGIAATTTDYTVELGGQTQELQFSYVLLDESAVDEGVTITY